MTSATDLMDDVTIEDVTRVINRHIARLMCNMEQASCPDLFRQAAKSEMTWLRSDVLAILRGEVPHVVL